jgi:hypothetical protein
MVAQITQSNGNGKFKPGNKGGAGGNFHARKVASFRAAVYRAATIGRIRKIADKLLELAEAGDLAAIRLALAYTVGEPAQVVELHTHDQAAEVSTYVQAVLSDPDAIAAHKRIAERLIGGRP